MSQMSHKPPAPRSTPRRSTSRVATILLFAPLLAACGSSDPVPVQRRPDASLLLKCELPSKPVSERPDNREIADAWLTAEQLLLNCAGRLDRLIDFLKG